jgi:hypothetical protein
MNDFAAEPARTHAVVVAVETYAMAGKDLDGPVPDACRLIRWLRACGVPDGQIQLFASPLPANASALAALGMAYEPARREPIYKYLTQTLPRRTGPLLLLSWGGHGLLTEADDRRLFYADATDADFLNLDLNSLLAGLRCKPYAGLPRQVAFIDACANHAVHLPGGDTFPIWDPDKDRGQFVLLGAKSGEVAVNARKAGVFSTALLDDLEAQPRTPFPPDLPALAERLIARFAALRAAKQARQTPVYFWERTWEGSSNRFSDIVPGAAAIAAVAATVPKPARPPVREWTYQEKADLRKRLLACPVISNPARREGVFNSMRAQIWQNYTHSTVATDDVANMITTCLNYSGGLEELVGIVRDQEGGARCLGPIEEWVEIYKADL